MQAVLDLYDDIDCKQFQLSNDAVCAARFDSSIISQSFVQCVVDVGSRIDKQKMRPTEAIKSVNSERGACPLMLENPTPIVNGLHCHYSELDAMRLAVANPKQFAQDFLADFKTNINNQSHTPLVPPVIDLLKGDQEQDHDLNIPENEGGSDYHDEDEQLDDGRHNVDEHDHNVRNERKDYAADESSDDFANNGLPKNANIVDSETDKDNAKRSQKRNRRSVESDEDLPATKSLQTATPS